MPTRGESVGAALDDVDAIEIGDRTSPALAGMGIVQLAALVMLRRHSAR